MKDNLPKINKCIEYEKQLFEYKDKILEYENLSLDDHFNKKAISDEDKTFITKEITRLTKKQTEIINNINKININILY